jgi:hypothetical protein
MTICAIAVFKKNKLPYASWFSDGVVIMAATVFTVLAVMGLFGAVTYLFVIEPRSKIHDL